MTSDNIHARIEHEIADLRCALPRVTDCHSALVHWNVQGLPRYSLQLDIRLPQHQTLIAGEPRDSAEAAISAAFSTARERLIRKGTTL
jgi:ribosome-associated translation inhibitor RaiA